MRLLSFSLESQLKYSEFNEKIELLANKIVADNINSIFILGKKKLYPIALEASLKIKEVSYIHCEGFSAGSLKHGPFALLDNNNLTLLLIDTNDTKNLHILKSTYYEIVSRTNNLYVINNNTETIAKPFTIWSITKVRSKESITIFCTQAGIYVRTLPCFSYSVPGLSR